MTQAQAKSRHKFYAFRIMRVIHRIRTLLYELHDMVLKSKQIPRIAKVNIYLFHSMIVDGKKEFLKKLCFVLKKGKLETFLALYNDRIFVLLLFACSMLISKEVKLTCSQCTPLLTLTFNMKILATNNSN